LPWDLPGLAGATLASARDHPLVQGTLLDHAGRGLLLPLRWDDEGAQASDGVEALDDDERFVATIAAARTAAPTLELGLTGAWPIIAAQSAAIGRERWRFQLFGALLGFAIASL